MSGRRSKSDTGPRAGGWAGTGGVSVGEGGGAPGGRGGKGLAVKAEVLRLVVEDSVVVVGDRGGRFSVGSVL